MSEPAAAGADSSEEQARANVYALAARLFYAAPDQLLLGELAHAPIEGAAAEARTAQGRAFVAAWRALVEACRSAFPVMLENEHTELFASPGKALVTPYLLHYLMRYESETPLVDLREHLARWGLARRPEVTEPEDHVAGICDVMRFAIATQHRDLADQKVFFERYVYPGGTAFCAAVSASPGAHFYKLVAEYVRAFLELEREAFANL
jgi:TorA maturation chaperone TorD